MLYSIFIYGEEDRIDAWTPEEEADTLTRHAQLREEYAARGRLGTVLRLLPRVATTVRNAASDAPLVTDGPFAETKEQLLGVYLLDCDSDAEAHAAARRLAFDGGTFEIRPVQWYDPGRVTARMPPEP